MEDRKSGHESDGVATRVIGPKVSQIANIFQSKGNFAANAALVDSAMLQVPLKTRRETSISPKHEQRDHFRDSKGGAEILTSTQITVVRTESHVARFNSAKALFEKLGTNEENRNVAAVPTGKVDRQKRPSSLSSNHASSESLTSPRSPSPKNMMTHMNGSVFAKPATIRNGVTINGSGEVAKMHSNSGSTTKHNGVGTKYDRNFKPEKPERKLNSKELIEKQKNWTAHFTKTKTTSARREPNFSRNSDTRSETAVPLTTEVKVIIPAPVATPETISLSPLPTHCQISTSSPTAKEHSSSLAVDARKDIDSKFDKLLIKSDLGSSKRDTDAHSSAEDIKEAKRQDRLAAEEAEKRRLQSESETDPRVKTEDVFSNCPADKRATSSPKKISAEVNHWAGHNDVSKEHLKSNNCQSALLESCPETQSAAKEVAPVPMPASRTKVSSKGRLNDHHHEVENAKDFVENGLLSELKSSCEELDRTAMSELFPPLEQDELIKPVLQFTLGDTSITELKLNSSTTTVLCNSSISEEDSGFLSSEAIMANRESDSALLDSMRFADDDSVTEEKPQEKVEQPKVTVTEMEIVPCVTEERKALPAHTTFADAMTADEADNLLSVRILEKKCRGHETLLSDEEAQEVVHLLSPSVEALDKQPDAQWVNNVLSAVESEVSLPRSITGTSNLDDSLISSNAGSVTGLEDTYASSHFGSQSGSESGLLCERMSSVGSLDNLDESTLQDRTSSVTDDESTYKGGFKPEALKEVFEESGVHYFEDGHFWLEVPGLPAMETVEDLYHVPPKAKRKNRVKFSSNPIKVYSTFTMMEYDRRNEDVDPVSASAEYELEKRVEKLEMHAVELDKSPEGLGLSIIGMGVGADAGLEKLGIFVKTITENGAASIDGRIQVNDQIIEVDGKSLVGVTQAYAAAVLRNTHGRVKFLIGREKDPENSEVAQLIRLSLQADKERDVQRRQMEHLTRQGQQFMRDDSSLTNSYSSSFDDYGFSRDGSVDTNNVDTLRKLLEQNEQKTAKAEEEIAKLKARLEELEGSNATKEEIAEKLVQSGLRLRDVERSLQITKRDVCAYQGILQQSQEQYNNLEKKYTRVKKLIKEFQQRELEFLHREEFYQQLLQEKDIEYNALVKALKDRIIQVEQELLETQRKGGFPVHLPQDNSNVKLVSLPQILKMPLVPPVRPLLEILDADISDIEDVDSEEGKTATVERKIPLKEELDEAVPPHELLDVSASKNKADLANRGGLANRQLPTASGKRSSSLSNSSSDCTLDNSVDNSEADSIASKDSIVDDKSETSRKSVDEPKQGQYVRQSVPQKAMASQYQPHHRSIPKHVLPTYATVPAKQQQLPQANQNFRYQHNQHQQGYSRAYQGRNVVGPPPSLAEQLKQVLAERERRTSVDTDDTHEDMAKSGVNCQFIWQPAVQSSPQSSVSSGSLSPGHVAADVNNSGSNFGSTDSNDVWCSSPQLQDGNYGTDKKLLPAQGVGPNEWSKEQVCHWLLTIGLEHYVTKFLNEQINGENLLSMETKDFKTLGVVADDRNKIKRKLKELRLQIEKEKRNSEKERKEKEKLQKKAEKLAEKASRRK